ERLASQDKMTVAYWVFVQDGDMVLAYRPDCKRGIRRKKGVEVRVARTARQLLLFFKRLDLPDLERQAVRRQYELVRFNRLERTRGDGRFAAVIHSTKERRCLVRLLGLSAHLVIPPCLLF